MPLAAPDIDENDIAAVTGVLLSGRLSRGPQLEALEKAFARFHGRRYAIGVNSGTSGLYLSLLAAHVEPGDWVLTTPLSFIATSNCIIQAGAIPVFLDVDPSTGNFDESQALQAISDLAAHGSSARGWLPSPAKEGSGRLKAFLPVHLFGQHAALGPVSDLASKLSIAVIEDACEGLGAKRHERLAGTWGQAGVFGFYANKQITMGEGGMVITDDDVWAGRIRYWRNQGQDGEVPGPSSLRPGFNFRLDEMSAALGLSQFRRLESLLEKRRRLASLYDSYLGKLPQVNILKPAGKGGRLSWFVYLIRVDPESRRRLIEGLAEEGIPSRIYFTPIHLQEPYRSLLGYPEGAFPVAEQWGRQALALPFFPNMRSDQVEKVCQLVMEITQ